jgi:hypothetical protein
MSNDMTYSPLLETLLSAFKDKMIKTVTMMSMTTTLAILTNMFKKGVAAFFHVAVILYWLSCILSQLFFKTESPFKRVLAVCIASVSCYFLFEEKIRSFATNRKSLVVLSTVLILALGPYVISRRYAHRAHVRPECSGGMLERVMNHYYCKSMESAAACKAYVLALRNQTLVRDIVNCAQVNEPHLDSPGVTQRITNILAAGD